VAVQAEKTEDVFVLPTRPADPKLYNDLIEAAFDGDGNAERTRRLRIAYHEAELIQLDIEWPRPTNPAEELSPWLTKRDAAQRVRAEGADGYPTDRFYNVIKRELGDVNLIHIDDLDDLVRRGKL
jgi:hypothetical protein